MSSNYHSGRLVLSRTLNEEIVVRDARGQELLRFAIISMSQGRARLSFEAPPHIRINRAEIDNVTGGAGPESRREAGQ
jgi:sRNA-binding carbon storage regulator CsrA